MTTRRLVSCSILALALVVSGRGLAQTPTAEPPAGEPAATPAATAPAPATAPAAAPAGEPAAAGEPAGEPAAAPAGEPAAAAEPAAATAPATAPAGEPAAAGEPTAEPADQAEEPAAPPLPAIVDEVNGTCKTPRQAWLQLLYWLQKGENRWKPAEAAKCFDTSRLKDPTTRGPELAEMLKEGVDAKAARLDVDAIPRDPDYLDKNGLARYEDPKVAEKISGIYVIKKGDRWLFSPDTLERIPNIVPASYGLKKHLPDWMRGSFLGVELWSYIGIILLIFVALAMQRIVVFVMGTYVRRMVKRTGLKYLASAVDHANRPIGGLVMALVFYIGFPLLLFPIAVSKLAMVATQALAAYSVVWLAYRLIDVLSDFMASKAEKTETKLDDQLVPLVTKTLKVFVAVVGGIFILQNLDVNVGSLLAGLGLGGLAFALAAKDTVANFFGSLMIFIDKPFQIGDWIEMAGTEGTIEEVGFRTSRVRTFYNSLVTVPNAMVVSSMVDNYGRRRFRRYVSTLGLTYDTPPEKVQAFCEGVRAIIAGMPGMRKDYYMVEFKDFGASALEIMMYCFMISPTWNDELRTRTHLNLEIMRLAKELGVSFAYPTQTLHVESLAQAGVKTPTHSGPSTPDDLARVIKSFGPGGGAAKPNSVKISAGYDCGKQWTATGTGDAEDAGNGDG